MHLHAHRLEFLRDKRGGRVFLETEFGVPMDMPTPRGQFLRVVGDTIDDRHDKLLGVRRRDGCDYASVCGAALQLFHSLV